MESELRRIAPVRAGNIVGVLYAVMMGSMMLVLFPFVFLVPMPDPQPGRPDPAMAFMMMRWFLLGYPVFGLVFGWLFGCLGAVTYNVVRHWTGGFLVEIEPRDHAG